MISNIQYLSSSIMRHHTNTKFATMALRLIINFLQKQIQFDAIIVYAIIERETAESPLPEILIHYVCLITSR